MLDILSRNLFIVKEHLGIFKAANNYDFHDPETGEVLLECREEKLGVFTKIFRFTDYKRMTPFDVKVRTPSGQQVVRIRRGFSMIRSKVEVLDEQDRPIGMFRQKVLSIGGRFILLDKNEQPVCELKGKWHSWEFSFVSGTREFAKVSKKWKGFGREMFTSADTYALDISEDVPADSLARQLIVAAVVCIDMVLKE